MIRYLRLLLACTALTCNAMPSFANFSFSPSGSTTMLAIDVSNQGTALCAAGSTECAASVPINTAGSPLFVAANPGIMYIQDGAGNARAARVDAGFALYADLQAVAGNTVVTAANGMQVVGIASGSGGNAITATSNTLDVNNKLWAGGVLGAMANYGTAPAAILVPGVNAFITNTPAVTLTSTTITGTVAVTESGTWTSRIVGNAGGLIDAATGAAVPANALYIGMAQGGNLTGLTGTSGNLNVQCANCSGSGVSTVDAAPFVATTSLFAGGGGFFQTTATNNALTNLQQGMFQVTANRALFTNLRNAAGAEVGIAAAPLQVSVANTAANGTAIAVTAAQATAANLNATVVGNGTFAVQAAQSGTWNVTNVSGTVSLPTGASTSALQPTNAAIGSTTAGQTGHLVQCAVTTGAPTYTTAQTDPLSCDTAGNIRVAATLNAETTKVIGEVNQGTSPWVVSNGGTFAVQATLAAETTKVIGTVRNTGNVGGVYDAVVAGTYPANALAVGVLNGANIGRLVGDETNGLWVNIKAGAGSGGTAIADKAAWAVSTTNMTLSGGEFTTGGATACLTGQACTQAMTATRGAFTDINTWAETALGAPSTYGTSPGSVNVIGVNAFVTNATTAIADNADAVATTSSAANSPVNNYNYIFNGTTFDRQRSGGVTGMAGVAVQATPSGGGTISSAIAPATPAGVNLKSGATTLYGVYGTTFQATPVFIKIYNATSASCGSGTPIARFMLPSNATAANGAGSNIPIPAVGVALGTGLSYCVTGGLPDNDTTAITANNTIVNFVWN